MAERKGRPLAVDIIIAKDNKSVLVQRKHEPFNGCWAVPGGYVELDETAETAAVREAKEETGFDIKLLKLQGVYSDPNRDPTRHTAAAAYTAEIIGGELKETDETKPQWFGLDELPELAFDHSKIVSDFKSKMEE